MPHFSDFVEISRPQTRQELNQMHHLGSAYFGTADQPIQFKFKTPSLSPPEMGEETSDSSKCKTNSRCESPPTPIANPGRASIRAALDPAPNPPPGDPICVDLPQPTDCQPLPQILHPPVPGLCSAARSGLCGRGGCCCGQRSQRRIGRVERQRLQPQHILA